MSVEILHCRERRCKKWSERWKRVKEVLCSVIVPDSGKYNVFNSAVSRVQTDFFLHRSFANLKMVTSETYVCFLSIVRLMETTCGVELTYGVSLPTFPEILLCLHKTFRAPHTSCYESAYFVSYLNVRIHALFLHLYFYPIRSYCFS